ncbi:MAG: hypothetical protein R2747_23235 [Pyrinomonadaceae bacterium]
MRKSLLFFVIVMISVSVQAQNVKNKKSIDQLINPEQIKETFIYWGEELLVIVPDLANGRKVIRAFHTPLNPNPETHLNYDNDILDWKTLRPIEKHRASGSAYYDYSVPGEVTIKFVSPKETVSRTVKINKPIYNLRGPGGGVLSASLPLKVGFSTSFSEVRLKFPYEMTYDPEVVDYELKVIGEEKVKVNDREFETYIVEIDSTQADSGVYYKQWVTKQPPHNAIKFIYAGKDGKSDYKSRPPYIVGNIVVKNDKGNN